MESGMETWSRSRIQPCTRACMQSGMNSGMESVVRPDMEPPSRRDRCPQGFSPVQVAILSVLKSQPTVIAYWQIAQQVNAAYGLNVTEGAVRGALDRLFPRGFLVRSRAANGRMQGNRYAFATDPCSHIRPYAPGMESGMDPSMEPTAQPGENAAPSILKETDRKNALSISSEKANQVAVNKVEALTEDDIAFHWPNLARAGFGTCQIRQILHRLEQVGTGPERIIQGLTHAEWELTAGKMYDQKDEPVASPLDWVFTSLARHGCYRKPRGYVSPQEQAELDAAKEAERIAAAHKERYEAEAAAWITQLTKDERHTILGSQNGAFPMPEDTALRIHFKEHIWPNIKSGNAQEMSFFEEGIGHGG